jgi:hypothetical protein
MDGLERFAFFTGAQSTLIPISETVIYGVTS